MNVTEKRQSSGNWHGVTLNPVYGDSPENKLFFASTPSGEIKMSISADAAEHFELGKAYYVDFTLAE